MKTTQITDPRLLGKWRSDKLRTLDEWVFSPEASQEDRAKVSTWFGRLTIRYTPARVFTEFESDHTVCAYRVAANDSSSVAIVRRTEGKDEIQHIHFVEPDLYVVPIGRNREYFRRVLE